MDVCVVTDDLHALVEKRRAGSVAIFRELKVGLDHNRQAWVHDPDGNEIELMQLDEISPQRKIARVSASKG